MPASHLHFVHHGTTRGDFDELCTLYCTTCTERRRTLCKLHHDGPAQCPKLLGSQTYITTDTAAQKYQLPLSKLWLFHIRLT